MILGLSLMAASPILAQQNPACANPQLNPNPLANVGSQFDLTYNVGNNGTVEISGNSEAQRMGFIISLGKCAPSVGGAISTLGIDALSGDALTYFDVIYDQNITTFYFTQKSGVPVGMIPSGMHTISIHAQVTVASSTATIGGSLNVQPNAGASLASQPTSDDAVAIYTNTTGTPLPVVLNSFAAQNSGCAVLLNWNTAAEQHFDRFEIERGAAQGYTVIGSVKARGNNSAYAFTDNKPAAGLNAYRLKMVDADGSFTYSEVVTARVQCPEVSRDITVYPNPSAAEVYVKGLNEGSTLRLMDITGRVLVEKTGSASVEKMDMSRLPAAIYTLQVVENGNLTHTVKVGKQ